MARYRVIEDVFAGGYVYNDMGAAIPANDLAPKIGDIVEGDLIANPISLPGAKQVSGISYTIKGGAGPRSGTMKIFIPVTKLKLMGEDTPSEVNNSSMLNTGPLNKPTAMKKITPAIWIAIVVVGYIVIKKIMK